MWWNEKALINFLKNRPDTYWDIRSIPLSELGVEHPEELTAE